MSTEFCWTDELQESSYFRPLCGNYIGGHRGWMIFLDSDMVYAKGCGYYLVREGSDLGGVIDAIDEFLNRMKTAQRLMRD